MIGVLGPCHPSSECLAQYVGRIRMKACCSPMIPDDHVRKLNPNHPVEQPPQSNGSVDGGASRATSRLLLLARRGRTFGTLEDHTRLRPTRRSRFRQSCGPQLSPTAVVFSGAPPCFDLGKGARGACFVLLQACLAALGSAPLGGSGSGLNLNASEGSAGTCPITAGCSPPTP